MATLVATNYAPESNTDCIVQLTDPAELEAFFTQDPLLLEIAIWKAEAKAFFFEIVDLEVGELEHLCTGSTCDAETADALAFMKQQDMYKDIVEEWAVIGCMRSERNFLSHPFDTRSPSRPTALRLYELTLKQTFCEKFRRVGMLGLIKVKVDSSKKKGKLEELENLEKLMAKAMPFVRML